MLNIVIPMAGRGRRFARTGEIGPKPLIEVLHRKRMIEYVIEYLTLREPHRFIFVCLRRTRANLDFNSFFRARTRDNYHLVLVQAVTRGPTATALFAKDFIDNGAELLISYCDSFFTFRASQLPQALPGEQGRRCAHSLPRQLSDGGLCGNRRRRWVPRTAEKEIISQTAAGGLYYFMKGSDFVAAAIETLAMSSNGKEVFVCPVFNELIRKRKRVTSFPITRDQRVEMGTPDDLSRSRDWLLQQEINLTRGEAARCG